MAAGTRGRPGMVMISPVTTTRKPAPADKAHLADRHGVAARRALQIWIGGEAVLGLGHADRQMPITIVLQVLELLTDLLVGHDVVCAIELRGDGLDLVPEGHVVVVDRGELIDTGLDKLDHMLGQFLGSGATVRPSGRRRWRLVP